ncbi:MAG: cupin domain-containing protein [Candidatus Chloroheliales bacterium]|nr:MAG: cupin domain-containing protein [Chloroflexota bacterium]
MSLVFEHAEDLPAQPGSADNFTGTVQIRAVAAGQGEPVSVGRVTFAHGGRTHWHKHTGEQTLYFLEGHGRVQVRGEGAADAAPGDVARIPPGAEHWHGTHPDEPQAMTHMAITFGTTTWLEPVNEEEYRG